MRRGIPGLLRRRATGRLLHRRPGLSAALLPQGHLSGRPNAGGPGGAGRTGPAPAVPYWVRFWSPGLVFGNQWTQDIDHLDPARIEWPENAYAFSLHQRTDIIDDDDQRFEGKSQQVGPLYYHPKSYVETLEEVKERLPNERILIDNMECNGYHRIIWTRWNNWPQPYDPDKIAILLK